MCQVFKREWILGTAIMDPGPFFVGLDNKRPRTGHSLDLSAGVARGKGDFHSQKVYYWRLSHIILAELPLLSRVKRFRLFLPVESLL